MTTDLPLSSSVTCEGPTTGTSPQADPLPTKRGEIGYRASLDPSGQSNAEPQSDLAAQDQQQSLPAQHPADRELPAVPSSELGPTPIANASGNQSSTDAQGPQRALFSVFKPRLSKNGIRSSTIFLLVIQGALLILTVAFWIILAKLILPSGAMTSQLATSVFVHVTFAMCMIVQVVLFERLVFRYRAERYAMLHPGQVLPDVFGRGEQVSTRLALAPWNRPPLPTYAAVLMESGVGTGDVEDNQIAIVPPPAYGHTRGSTLILAGFISAEFQEQARLAREARGERGSMATIASVESNKSSDKSRPVSYVTVDSEWNARCDMSRATYLAETLARLEAEGERDITSEMISPGSANTAFADPVLPRELRPQPSPAL